MTRTLLIAAAFGLTFTTAAGAMNLMPHVPSLWPAEGAFDTSPGAAPTVTRAQTAETPAAPAPEPTRHDR